MAQRYRKTAGDLEKSKKFRSRRAKLKLGGEWVGLPRYDEDTMRDMYW